MKSYVFPTTFSIWDLFLDQDEVVVIPDNCDAKWFFRLNLSFTRNFLAIIHAVAI